MNSAVVDWKKTLVMEKLSDMAVQVKSYGQSYRKDSFFIRSCGFTPFGFNYGTTQM